MSTIYAPPRLASPLSARAEVLAYDWAELLTTITGWGTYVDEEFGMTEEERALWRVLVIIRDALAATQGSRAIDPGAPGAQEPG